MPAITSGLPGYSTKPRQRGVRIIEINPSNETLIPRRAQDRAHAADRSAGRSRRHARRDIRPPTAYRLLQHARRRHPMMLNARPRPLALYFFGPAGPSRREGADAAVSGGVTVNDTLLHVAADSLPFGGVGASGIGAYHGEFGFNPPRTARPSSCRTRSMAPPSCGRPSESSPSACSNSCWGGKAPYAARLLGIC